MRRKVIAGALILVGIILFSVPFLFSQTTQQDHNTTIEHYDNVISDLSDTEKADDIAAAENYNQIISTGTETVSNENYYNLLSYGDGGEIGYISIPKVGIDLPIYHGTTEEILAKGAGHMENTSLPIGGENTHSVIVGHTGLTYRMFDGLHDLVEGDMFYITVQDQTLEYRISGIYTVLSNATDYTAIVPGKDLVTLVTCFPFGINSHRLLVQGERVN